jgi:N utilization substance protein A
VVVPDKQLSLAIGKEGQNARLAAKLSGWRIDIKSASAVETEKVEVAPAPVAKKEPETGVDTVKSVGTEEITKKVETEMTAELEAAVPEPLVEEAAEMPVIMEPGLVEESIEPEEPAAPEEPATTIETTLIVPKINIGRRTGSGEIRFAEDIMRQDTPRSGGKKGKKRQQNRERGEDGAKGKRRYEINYQDSDEDDL